MKTNTNGRKRNLADVSREIAVKKRELKALEGKVHRMKHANYLNKRRKIQYDLSRLQEEQQKYQLPLL